MTKRIIVGAIAALSLTAAAAGTAAAAPPVGAGSGGVPRGIQCQQKGIATLQALGLTSSVARNGIEVVGVGTLPLRTVLSLHRTNPGLFQTGGVSVKVGDATVPATWCDGI